MKKWMTLFKNLMSKILAEMKIRRKVFENLISKLFAEMKIWRKCLARACLPDLRWEILSQLVAQTPNTDSPRSASSHYLCHHCHHLSLLKLSVSSLSCYQQTHTITIVIIWVSLVAQLEYHLYFKIQGTDKYSKVKSYLGPGHLCHLLLLLKVEKAKEIGDPRVGGDVRLAAEFPISKRWLKIIFLSACPNQFNVMSSTRIQSCTSHQNLPCTNSIRYLYKNHIIRTLIEIIASSFLYMDCTTRSRPSITLE